MAADVIEYLDALKQSRKFGPQVVCHKKYEPKEPQYSDGFPKISDPLVDALETLGIDRLFTHQYQAIDAAMGGVDIIVATPTASGKSMVYNLPVLDEICQGKLGFSMYIFPLKALAQDQKKVFDSLFQLLPEQIRAGCKHPAALFDGDTSSYQRRKIKDTPPRVLFTNPEMIHLSLLPYHSSWREFFGKLKYVVIDEVHCYRGILGSHMAWVLRRLQRIAAYYGAKPTFILLSATIGNPSELGRRLLGRNVRVIEQSGAPQAEKNMVFINPWDGAPFTASQLLEASVKRGLRTIVYTQSRKMTELINLWTAPRLGKDAHKLSAYRAGFLPEERRDIEHQLFNGELLGVISTSALELGIDIGDLDVCILVGYPGSIMATWQRGGRVGRAMNPSVTILIGQEDALDQHFMREPEDFFSRLPESAVLNPENTTIMDQHLVCCAAELTIERREKLLSSDVVKARVINLTEKGGLLETATGGQWITTRKYPQRLISLRGGGLQMTIIDGDSGEIIGEIDSGRAMKECHPGAVYLHRSTTWVIEKCDLVVSEVIANKDTPRYFTRPMSEKRTEILEVIDRKLSFGVQVSFGRVRVTERVTGYQKRHSLTQKLITTVGLDLPEQIIETEGIWIDIPGQIVTTCEENRYHFMGGIHALEHAMIALFPLLVLCDRNDIGGISCPLHEQTEMASVFIYDGYVGGVGLSREAFLKIDQLLNDTMRGVSRCECKTGCPSCVHSPKCGSGNRPIDKRACLYLLSEMIKRDGTRYFEQRLTPLVSTGENAENNHATFVEEIPIKKGLDALPSKFVVFDLETKYSAEEVGGWGNCHEMGVSVGVVYDSVINDYISYTEDEIEKLIAHLLEADLVVGFNNIRFDNRVLSAYSGFNFNALPNLDLLQEVHNYLGYRLSLNRLAEVTLEVEKTADGLQALAWYKEGRIDLITKYCKKDVEITRDLLFFALEEGHLLFENKAGKKVRLPLALNTAIGKMLRNGKKSDPL